MALQKRVKPAVTGSHCNGMVRSDTCKSLLLATLERVFVLSESQLILKFVFFKLVLDILCDLFGIFTYCVYLVTSAPKRSVAVLVFQICMPLMYEQTAFSFENPMKRDALILGGISTSMWIWSGHTSASIIVTPFHPHNSLRIFPISARFSP